MRLCILTMSRTTLALIAASTLVGAIAFGQPRADISLVRGSDKKDGSKDLLPLKHEAGIEAHLSTTQKKARLRVAGESRYKDRTIKFLGDKQETVKEKALPILANLIALDGTAVIYPGSDHSSEVPYELEFVSAKWERRVKRTNTWMWSLALCPDLASGTTYLSVESHVMTNNDLVLSMTEVYDSEANIQWQLTRANPFNWPKLTIFNDTLVALYTAWRTSIIRTVDKTTGKETQTTLKG